MQKVKYAIAVAAFSLAVPAIGQAATVSYTNSDPTPQVQLTVDDAASPGKFRFSLSTLLGTADFLGLGFNFAGSMLSNGDLTLVSATGSNDESIKPVLKLFGDNTASQSTCGNGCNFNGSGSASDFDYIIRIGGNGGGKNNYVKTVVFDVAFAGDLSSYPFSQFAFRAQSTSNPEGSIKADLNPEPQPAPVPLPAGLPLLGSGLLAIGALRRRKRAA